MIIRFFQRFAFPLIFIVFLSTVVAGFIVHRNYTDEIKRVESLALKKRHNIVAKDEIPTSSAKKLNYQRKVEDIKLTTKSNLPAAPASNKPQSLKKIIYEKPLKDRFLVQ